MDASPLIAIAKQAARNALLDPALVCAVCEQESEWNPYAVRPEPGFEKKYIAPLHLLPLEDWTRSMSWGLMQIMGETARELGFSGKFLSELCDPATGVLYGCRKLRQCLAAHGEDEKAALLCYNGGSDAAYPAQVIARMKKYW